MMTTMLVLLTVVTVGCSLIGAVYMLVYWSDKQEPWTYLFPRIIVFFGLLMSLLVPLLIPIDTTLTAAFPHLTFMQGIWEWLLAIIAAMSLLVMPFALFYFDERMLNNRTCSNALGCSMIQTGILAFVILALGFGLSFAVGFA